MIGWTPRTSLIWPTVINRRSDRTTLVAVQTVPSLGIWPSSLPIEGLRIRKEEMMPSALLRANERLRLFSFPVRDPATGQSYPTVTVDGQTFFQVPVGPIAQTIINRFFPVPNLQSHSRGLNHVSVAQRIEDRDRNIKQHLRNATPEMPLEMRTQVDPGFSRLRRRSDSLLSFSRRAGLRVNQL